MTRLELPYPVSVNDLYQPVYRGGRASMILTKQAREYRQKVAEAVLIARSKRHRDKSIGRTFHGEDALAIELDLHPPDDGKRHDVDNALKATLDGLQNAAVFADDSQIERLTIQRHPAQGRTGRLLVTIRSLEP